MDISIERKELVSTIKELNSLDVVPKIKTKDIPELPLLMTFLESIESIDEDSEEEGQLTKGIIKYYNKMARKVEKMDSQAILDFVNTQPKKVEKPAEEVQELMDYVEHKEEVPTKTKLKQITDIMETVPEGHNKNIFNMNISSNMHQILKRLVAGKSEGFLVKKDIADKVEIAAAIKQAKKKNPDLVVNKEFIDGKFIYKFFGEKSFWKSRK